MAKRGKRGRSPLFTIALEANRWRLIMVTLIFAQSDSVKEKTRFGRHVSHGVLLEFARFAGVEHWDMRQSTGTHPIDSE